MNSYPKISIIIAVYNCEQYIEACARSLFDQTFNEIEYIFINDATPDNSINILERITEDYPKRKPFIKIINLDTNKGVSNARRIGIENALGEYVIHADSDDWVDNNMYERLYLKAKETGADIVGCNFRHEFKDNQFDFHQQYAETIEENIRRLINGRIFPSLCTSLTRRTLIKRNHITFPDNLNMGEDLYFNLQLYLHANKIVYVDWAPYHYRHTDGSSCVKRTRESINSDIAIAKKIEVLMKKNKLSEKYEKEICYRKFISKLPLIQNFSDIKDYHEWINIFPETNEHLWEYTQIDFKFKIELWLALHKMPLLAKVFKQVIYFQHQLKTKMKQIK